MAPQSSPIGEKIKWSVRSRTAAQLAQLEVAQVWKGKQGRVIMRARPIGAVMAIQAMVLSTVSVAADTVGTVASGSRALVARDGKMVPAVAGMPLYSGDRIITRAGGRASIKMANSCALSIGASTMLPVAGTACVKPSTVSFDRGRAGYPGRGSAFDDDDHTALWIGGALVLIGGVLYLVLRKKHHKDNVPTSP